MFNDDEFSHVKYVENNAANKKLVIIIGWEWEHYEFN